MGSSRHIHRGATVVLSLAMVAVGAALIVQVVARSGGLISARVLMGALFIAAGVGRLYLEARRTPRGGDPDRSTGAPPEPRS